MSFDHSRHRAQVARIVTHDAGEEISLQLEGRGTAFPAVISAEKPTATRALPDVGAQNLHLVTIARAHFDGRTLPREGQHFTDSSGLHYRIQEDRTIAHAPTLVFACGTVRPLA